MRIFLLTLIPFTKIYCIKISFIASTCTNMMIAGVHGPPSLLQLSPDDCGQQMLQNVLGPRAHTRAYTHLFIAEWALIPCAVSVCKGKGKWGKCLRPRQTENANDCLDNSCLIAEVVAVCFFCNYSLPRNAHSFPDIPHPWVLSPQKWWCSEAACDHTLYRQCVILVWTSNFRCPTWLMSGFLESLFCLQLQTEMYFSGHSSRGLKKDDRNVCIVDVAQCKWDVFWAFLSCFIACESSQHNASCCFWSEFENVRHSLLFATLWPPSS